MIHTLGTDPVWSKSSAAVYLIAKDGQIDKVDVVDPENIDVGRKPIPSTYAMTSGRWVTTEHLPTKVAKSGGRSGLGDFETAHLGQIVTDRFKPVVEDICGADTHQFEPVEITNANKNEDRHRWWFVPALRLFALRKDLIEPPLNDLGYYPSNKGPSGWHVTFDASIVDDHPIFCPGEFLSSPILVNDDFISAVEAAGLTGLAFRYSFPIG